MSSRHDHESGSSRSTRDDSKTQRDRYSRESGRNRSRSRSPQHRRRGEEYPKYLKGTKKDYKGRESKSPNKLESQEEVPAPPPPPRISKISIAFSKSGSKVAPIKMNLNSVSAPKVAVPDAKPKLAAFFNADDDDEPEEMPVEARMRMRNIGRETPTSAGPNSFGKTKQGFCNSKKVFEKNLNKALETTDKPSLQTGFKLPQTIYKLSGP